MRPKRLKTAVVSTNGCDNKSDTNSVIDSNDGSINNLTSIENNNNNAIEDNHKTNSEKRDPILDYSPKLCLRCHCKQNDPFDNSTPIWSAVFQPKTNESDSYRFVATCGANMVCIIDCLQSESIERSGKSVIARYIDKNKEEEFVSLAWSDVQLNNNKKHSKTLILAVGGKNAILLFSNLKEFHCYERVVAHSDQINSLVFVENDLLLSASYDTHIKLWRICGPNDEKITQLLKDIETKDNLLSLFYSQKYELLMASGMKGLFFWLKPLDLNESSDTVLAQMKTKTLVDGLHGLPEDKDLIAIRIHLTKCISIIDLKKVSELLSEEIEKNDNKSEIKTILFSKVLKAKLKSFNFEYPFIYLSAEKNLLVSGGPNGQIWVYNTNGFDQYFGTNQIISADRILEWPIIENITKDHKKVFDDKKPVIVNTVAVSPDLKYMIACTSINLICIWRKT